MEAVKLFALSELPPGASVRFPVTATLEGFAVRAADGSVRAYVNVCPHRLQPVDVGDGRIFVSTGELECSAHGARFDPSSGACKGGPCEGRGLTPISVEEREGAIWMPTAPI